VWNLRNNASFPLKNHMRCVLVLQDDGCCLAADACDPAHEAVLLANSCLRFAMTSLQLGDQRHVFCIGRSPIHGWSRSRDQRMERGLALRSRAHAPGLRTSRIDDSPAYRLCAVCRYSHTVTPRTITCGCARARLANDWLTLGVDAAYRRKNAKATHVLTAGDTGQVRIWNMDTYTCVSSLRVLQGTVLWSSLLNPCG